jgi:hypothetical protein
LAVFFLFILQLILDLYTHWVYNINVPRVRTLETKGDKMDKLIKETKKLLQLLALIEEAVIRIVSISGWIVILMKVLGII